ncbi:MAG: YhcH/YjgK/YiaL family protein [Vicinamibacterales bacterium]
MILDDLACASTYFDLSPRLKIALEYLQSTDLSQLPPGRHDVDGDRVFASVADYETRAEHETRWEAHRRHIDVQVVIAGEELIGITPLQAVDADPYDADRDVLFGSGPGEFLRLTPGRFIVLFPHDAHRPGVRASESSSVRKLVIKILIGE